MLVAAEQRLEAALGPAGSGLLKSVDGAISFQALAARPPQRHGTPAAFVIPIAQRAEPSSLVNAVRQRTTQRFGVLLALAGRNRPRGDGLSEELEEIEAAVKGVFRGWQATEEHEPAEHRRSATSAFANGLLFYLIEFETARQES
ncbi:MAG: hypothetical protein NXI21_01765 [Alphaproteobacteria bacterium]|nr:hypothetical protein [Alphaproteobacteria bacterium]